MALVDESTISPTRRFVRSCLCAGFGLFALQLAGVVRADAFEWPDFQPGLEASSSHSPVKAKAPPSRFKLSPAEAGTSPERANFGGYWEGWMCRDKIVDINVLVKDVTNEGAKVRYAVASKRIKPTSYIRSASFDGDVLRFFLRKKRTEVILGTRQDGQMNMKWHDKKRDAWCTGVMQRIEEPPPS